MDFVYRNMKEAVARLSRRLREPVNVNIFTDANAADLVALADIPIAQVIDDIGSGNPGIASRDALGIVVRKARRGLSW